jgi:hypothetical protein
MARAESIHDLDNFLLVDVAPSAEPFTLNELLGRAERVVERQQDSTLAGHADCSLQSAASM